MKRLIAIVVMLVLVGCSAIKQEVRDVVGRDLSTAIKRGEAVLGSDDALVVCYKALDQVLSAEDQAAALDDGLLLDAAMRARITSKVMERVGPVLKKACGEITVEVLLKAAKRGR